MDIVQQSNGRAERWLAIGAVTSTEFLRQLAPSYDAELVRSPHIKRVVGWALEYFEEHRNAPGKYMEDLFHAWARKAQAGQRTEVQLTAELLEGLSDQYVDEKFNVPYVMGLVADYFRRAKLENLREDIALSLEQDDLVDAEKLVLSFDSVRVGAGLPWVNPYTDEQAIQTAYAEGAEPLFQFDGPLGEFWNSQLMRGGMVALLAPEKRGKTMALWGLAHQAYKCRCNVAFFGVGDMNQDQYMHRKDSLLTGLPKYIPHPGAVQPVLDCLYNQNDECDLKWRTCVGGVEPFESGNEMLKAYRKTKGYTPCTQCLSRKGHEHKYRGAHWFQPVPPTDETISPAAAIDAGRLFTKRTAGKDFRLVAVGELGIHQLLAQLELWELEGWLPDVVVVDYFDNMEAHPEDRHLDWRNQQNSIWRRGRGMALDRGMLLVTATQADTASYHARTMGMDNFSEDKRKLSHVTFMVGLNQTKAEKEQGVARLNRIVQREGDVGTRQLTVLQDFRVARPFVGAYW